MQLTPFLTALFLAGGSVVLANPTPASAGLCKKPHCTSHCPDGYPFDCCVVYVRDPCSDHQLPSPCKGPDCVCFCPDGATSFLCNANYFVDPCKDLTA